MFAAYSIAEPSVGSRQFTLRDVLVAVAVCAVALSIWRLPGGDWFDIPCSMLSGYFAISLAGHAVAVLQARTSSENHSQRAGATAYAIILSTIALILVAGLLLRSLAAAGVILTAKRDPMIDFVTLPTLPRGLQILALVAALGIGSPSVARPDSRRERLYVAIAVCGALVCLIRFLFAPFLVYLAVSGVELAERPRLLSPEQNLSTQIRLHDFVFNSLVGFGVVALNLAAFAGLAKNWRRPAIRFGLLALLTLGLAAEVFLAWQISGPSLHRLSPDLAESVRAPASAFVACALLVLVAAAAFCWRGLVRWSVSSDSDALARRAMFFHETWFAALAVGVIGASDMVIVNSTNWLPTPTAPTIWQLVALTSRPLNFLWLAAAIAGFTLAYVRWRTEAPRNLLPEIEIGRFATLSVCLAILPLAAAPILIAFCFSVWPWLLRSGLLSL
jgi:hypothetical protein